MNDAYNKTFMKYFHQRTQSGIIESADLKSEVTNPICGDELQLFINIKKNKIVNDAKFLTSGCASTIAIAAYGTEYIIGKSMNEIKTLSSSELKEGVGGLPANKNHAAALFIEAIKKLQIAKMK